MMKVTSKANVKDVRPAQGTVQCAQLLLGGDGFAQEVVLSIRQRPGTRNFMLEFTLPDGRRVRKSSGTADRKEALRKEEQLKIQLGASVLDIAPAKAAASDPITLIALVERFLAFQTMEHPDSVANYYTPALRPFARHLGEERLVSTITVADLEEYLAFKKSKTSGSNRNKILNVLRVLFERAIKWGHIRENPAKPIERAKEVPFEATFLSGDQQKKLLVACAEPLRTVVLVALRTGLRRKEILGLCRARLDFKNGLIGLKGSKNGKLRYVPMLHQSREILERLAAAAGSDTQLFFELSPNAVRLAYARARKRAGIKVRFHDLRHTFASDAAASGMDPRILAKMLGHSTTRMTERYTHFADTQLRAAAKAMGDYLAARKDGGEETPLEAIGGR